MVVSVVIPAYNAAGVLSQCVSSVLSQDGVEVEVVIVDDGSADDTLAVATGFAEADPRVRVMSKPNGGVSSARNAGLDAATGEVVVFVDADDALVPGALSSVCSRLSYGGVDCLVFGMQVEPPELTPLTLAHRLAPSDGIFEDDVRRLVFREHTHPYAFRVAFMRDFLTRNDLRFDETLSLGEDEAFLMVAYGSAHRVITSSEQLYLYRMNADSASHKDNESKALSVKLDKHLRLVESVLTSWKQRGLDRSCDPDLLNWALDLLMLDVSRLRPTEQAAFYQRLWPVLTAYFGPDGGRDVAYRVTAPCVKAIQRAAFSTSKRFRVPVVSKALLITFYVTSRGFGAVAERALAALRGRGAY